MSDDCSLDDDSVGELLDVVDGRATPGEEGSDFLTSALTVEKLVEVTGCDDLDLVTKIELRVNCENTSLAILGDVMPELQQIRLSGSNIPSLRELGTHLTRLRVVWLNNCGVRDLSGIQFCHQLVEVFLAFNHLHQLVHLAGLLNLEILDLEGNNIESIGEVSYLRSLTELGQLTLAGNPIATTLSQTAEGYRTSVGHTVGRHLRCLDDATLSDEERAPPDPEEEDCSDDSPSRPTASTQVRHVDPSAFAELQVLNAAIRDHKGLGLAGMVEEAHRGLSSRQSHSATGPRSLASRNGHPQTVARGLDPATLRSVSSAPAEVGGSPSKSPAPPKRQSPPPTSDSTLEGKSSLAGNITRSLRATKSNSFTLTPLCDTSSNPNPETVPQGRSRRRPTTNDDDGSSSDEENSTSLSALYVDPPRPGSAALMRKAGPTLSEQDKPVAEEIAQRDAAFSARLKELKERHLTVNNDSEGSAISKHQTMSDKEVLGAVFCYKQSVTRQLESDLRDSTVGDRSARFESLDLKGDFHDNDVL